MNGVLESLAVTDVKRLVPAIEACGEALKEEKLDTRTYAEVAQRFRDLVREHTSQKVRSAVADAIVHAPDDLFAELLPRLLEDRHHLVVTSAKATEEARKKRRLVAARHAKQMETASAALTSLRAHGAEAVRNALDVASARQTQLLDRIRHETAKVVDSQEGELKMIEDDPACNDNMRRAIAQIREAQQLQMKIINSAQELMRLPKKECQDESVRELVGIALQQLRVRIGERAARLDVAVEIEDSMKLHCDRGLLLQAFANILQNAVEAYDKKEGPIRLHIGAEGQCVGTQVKIEFRDFGVGISPESLPHVGQPYRSSKGEQGRGLGVANVKKMVEALHGGEVVVSSQRGEGTLVRIVLPRSQG